VNENVSRPRLSSDGATATNNEATYVSSRAESATASKHAEAPLIERLQDEIHGALEPIISHAGSYALFDFPDHNNVGDSAIWLGELAYLRRRYGMAPAYVCRADHCNFTRLSTRYRDALILIHGGGNFGDLWRWHHDRREALLERFPNRRIVQMPQTLKFESKASLARTREIIKRHANFVLLVRDKKSYELATSEFDCSVVLCPDMALCLGPLARIGSPRYDLLMLLRNDKERAEGVREVFRDAGRDALIDDWRMDEKPMRAARKVQALAESVVRFPASLADPDDLRFKYFMRLAERRVERGLKLLSSGRFIVTDRLHAYVLALLLDIPRAVVDNSYGKNSGFIDTWMCGADRVGTYKTLESALEVWQRSSRTL